MYNAPIAPWAGGSFQASQRLLREMTDGTAFFKGHAEAKEKIAKLHALCDIKFGPREPRSEERSSERRWEEHQRFLNSNLEWNPRTSRFELVPKDGK